MGERGQKEFAYIRSDQAAPTGIFFLIKEHILCPGRTEYAVPQEFRCRDVGRPCGEFARVIDEVSACCDADAMWICLLWTKVDDNPGVRDCSICGDEEDFFVSHHKNCICTFLPRFIVPLCHAAEILSEGGLPYFHCRWVVH